MANIILAEDDYSMRQFLTAALEKVGHKVNPCEDGLHALREAEKAPEDYDVLLADIVMPGMDGIELSQRLTDLNPKIRVVFITGFSGVTVNAQDEQQKQAKVLSKPFHLNDLVDQIDTVLTH